jgi:hypothetical protein
MTVNATFYHYRFTKDKNYWYAFADGPSGRVEVVSSDSTHALCRALVKAGVPDQDILFSKPDGMKCLSYGSIHKEAKWSLDRNLKRTRYKPYPQLTQQFS